MHKFRRSQQRRKQQNLSTLLTDIVKYIISICSCVKWVVWKRWFICSLSLFWVSYLNWKYWFFLHRIFLIFLSTRNFCIICETEKTLTIVCKSGIIKAIHELKDHTACSWFQLKNPLIMIYQNTRGFQMPHSYPGWSPALLRATSSRSRICTICHHNLRRSIFPQRRKLIYTRIRTHLIIKLSQKRWIRLPRNLQQRIIMHQTRKRLLQKRRRHQLRKISSRKKF